MLRLIIIFITLCSGGLCDVDVFNSDVESFYYINNSLVTVTHNIIMINKGATVKDSYVYIEHKDNFFLGCSDGSESKLESQSKISKKNTSYIEYKIALKHPLNPTETCQLSCEVITLYQVKPVRETRKVNEDQLVVYTGNIYYFSPYVTLNYNVFFKFNTRNFQVPRPGYKQHGSIVNFNFTYITPYLFEENKMFFVYNEPIFVVENLLRTIHVSLYGKIWVEDQVFLYNRGSRYTGDYKFALRKGVPSWFYTFLPTAAEDIKFLDHLGNNSFSQIINSKTTVTLKHTSRYPLLGGWRYNYVIQYYLPSFTCLFQDQSNGFYLQLRLIDHIINNVVVERASVSVILPEFSAVEKVTIPKGFVLARNDTSFPSLSYFGKPSLVFEGANLIENHIALFMVKFKNNKYYTLTSLLLIIIYIEFCFLLYLIWTRMPLIK